MSAIRVIVISSVRPAPTSAGEVILYRHLAESPGLQLDTHGAEPAVSGLRAIGTQLLRRLNRTRFHRFAQDYRAWRDGRWLEKYLPKTIASELPTLVLTVAQGDAFGAARRFARRHHLPLVSIFHDWWPDMPALHPRWRAVLEHRFRELYELSDLAFCVSEGMKSAFGANPRARVLYPIPAKRGDAFTPQSTLPKRGDVFRVLYAGNLFGTAP